MIVRAARFAVLCSMLLLCMAAACMRSAPLGEAGSPGEGRSRAANEITLDVPALVGRDIDQLRETLGTPLESRTSETNGVEPTAAQLRTNAGEGWVNTFDRQGLTVVATFNARTRKVRDLVLLGPDEEDLMRRGNLNLVNSRYVVLPVSQPDNPEQVIGVRVVSRSVGM